MTKGRNVVQEHHISYNPEVKVKIYKGEHWLLTQLQRRKKVSVGFIRALKVWMAINEHSGEWLE